MDGKRALTGLTVVSHTPHVQAGWLTTVDLLPHTGRRHQLRRHCAALGFPICGDDLYASATAAADGEAEGVAAGFVGKRSAGLFLQSVEVALPYPEGGGRHVHAEVAEARKFARQRERSRLGWEFERKAQVDR